MKPTNILGILLVVLSAVLPFACSCSCVPTSFKKNYYDSKLYVSASVVYSYTLGQSVSYLLKTEKVYKGCNVPNFMYFKSTTQCSACCIFLKTGKKYLFPLRRFDPMQDIHSCQGILAMDSISASELTFLGSRSVCCDGSCHCASGSTAICKSLPCDVEKAPCHEATACVNNNCGACTTDWLTSDGGPACLPDPNPFRN